ncbi:hypothetical protein Vretifemale_8091, partial [Volvox reticuliferus]
VASKIPNDAAAHNALATCCGAIAPPLTTALAAELPPRAVLVSIRPGSAAGNTSKRRTVRRAAARTAFKMSTSLPSSIPEPSPLYPGQRDGPVGAVPKCSTPEDCDCNFADCCGGAGNGDWDGSGGNAFANAQLMFAIPLASSSVACDSTNANTRRIN